MIGTSAPEYLFIRVCIVLLRLLTPSCAGLLLAAAIWHLWQPVSLQFIAHIPRIVLAYAAVECLFFLTVYLPWSHGLKAAAEHPPLRPREGRQKLFQLCQSNIPDMEAYIRVWFHGAKATDLCRGNVEDWVLWAIFSADRSQLAAHPEWTDELAEYVTVTEKRLGVSFPEGRNPKVFSIRLTLDRVNIIHRPFIWYTIVGIVDFLTCCALWLLGFTHYATPRWFSVFPFRPYTACCSRSSEPVSYWVRPHRATNRHPILFVHGLGIGLWAYIRLFYQLSRAERDVGVIALELLPVSMRISSPLPSRAAMVTAVRNIVSRHRFNDYVFVAHSYGSVVASHVLHADDEIYANDSHNSPAPNEQSPFLQQPAPSMHALVLIDPVALLLHLPTTASNFVYREPQFANEHQLWFFASRDAGISHTLSRRFFWADNLMWKSDLSRARLPGGAAVVLSQRDQITPAADIWTYLTGEPAAQPGMDGSSTSGHPGVFRWRSARGATVEGHPLDLEVLYELGLDHAQIFDDGPRLAQVVAITQRLLADNESTSLTSP